MSILFLLLLCLVAPAEVSDDGPLISGARERYELNEQLDVNCTAPLIRPQTVAASHRLTWLLNNQTVHFYYY